MFRKKKKDKEKDKEKSEPIPQQEDQPIIENDNNIDVTTETTTKSDFTDGISTENLKDEENSIPDDSIIADTDLHPGVPAEIESGEKEREDSYPITPEETDEEINKLLLSIVSGFSEYFYGVAEEIFGSRPQKINFDSIRSDRKIGTTGIQLVSVNFSCELGRGRAGLAVKIYDKASDVAPVISKMEFLSQKIKPYRQLGVSTPSLVFTRKQILVMEGIRGESFRHSTVPITEKYRLAGKCLAVLHGSKVNATFTEQYRTLEKQVIITLPLKESDQEFLLQKFSSFPLEKTAKSSGAISFGDFHSGNLLYEISLYKSPILVSHLIDPEFLEFTNPIHDRFIDIANFFVNRAISEFQLKGNLFQISRELRSFMAGYEEILAYDRRTIKNYYPKTDSFNYHLALGILLSILNLISMPDMSPDYVSQQMKPRIKLTMLLLESPSLLEGHGETIAINQVTTSES
ncbi:MAG: hypothetical protein ACXAC7_13085 [Candidatus Hodarchaeales archaeon]